MANKQEVITMLEESIKVEESVIPLYSRHVTNTFFLSGFKKDSQIRVGKILDKLRTDSQRHRDIFERMLAKVKESARDVY